MPLTNPIGYVGFTGMNSKQRQVVQGARTATQKGEL